MPSYGIGSLIVWAGSGLILYLIKYSTVSVEMAKIGKKEYFNVFAMFAYVVFGPICLPHYFRALKMTEVKVKQTEKRAQEQAAAKRIRILAGPDPLDDYNSCKTLKADISHEMMRLERDQAEAEANNFNNLYILVELPELADDANPQQAICDAIKARLAKLETALADTKAQMADLADSERERRRQREEDGRRQQERTAALKEAEAKQEAREATIYDQAKLRTAAIVEASGLQDERCPLSVETAIRLWKCSYYCLRIERDDDFMRVETPVVLASALLENSDLIYNYSEERHVICRWFDQDYKDHGLAAELATLNSPDAAAQAILARLDVAKRILAIYEEELLKLKCELAGMAPEPADEDSAEVTEQAPEEREESR